MTQAFAVIHVNGDYAGFLTRAERELLHAGVHLDRVMAAANRHIFAAKADLDVIRARAKIRRQSNRQRKKLANVYVTTSLTTTEN